MIAFDTPHMGARVEEAWERLLELENQVQELRRLLAEQGVSAPREDAARAGDAPLTVARRASSRPATPGAQPAAQQATRWRVTSLGMFRITCSDREPPSCSSRRGWGVLQYLLTRPGYAATRDALIDAFWPDAAPGAGAHSLQMAVHALRRALRGYGPDGSNDVVLYRDGQYLINPALSIDVDVEQFRAACRRGRELMTAGQYDAACQALEAALRLYGGPFLGDAGYDAWAEPERQVLEELRLAALGLLSDAYAARSEWDQAAARCREILAVDPYREDAVRKLLRYLAAGGRLAEVERTYRACREQIWQDLQVDPAPETIHLYRQLTRPAARSTLLTSKRALSART
ncbi:MAG: winged helix-turn-helix domain-containing protein [Chloroflexi bacterium]|nr:winged helix-turn-helix domain-containing protein [Chloroflexota bacterium]